MHIRPILGALGLAAGLTLASHGTAHALPNCGGQHAPPQPVPYDCALPGLDITVGQTTRHFSAVVHANGTNVSVDYLMTGGTLPVDVPIRITHHDGISGAGLNSDTASGFIRAGSTTATLVDSSPCRAGQLDVMAVVTAPGSGSRFRVGGPWIENGTGCTDTTSIPTSSTPATVPAPPTTTPAVPVPPVVPPSTGQGPPVPSVPAGPPITGTLPATGSSEYGPVTLAALLLGPGAAAIVVAATRRRAAVR